MHPRLTPHSAMIVASAYELDRQEVIADELIVERWNEPADDLVASLSRIHTWRAEQTVSYLALLKELQHRPNPGHTSPSPTL
jgi:hypothetical protein